MTESQTEAARDIAELVARAQAGDRRALDDLIAGHLPVLYNVIGRGLNGHADVDDVVQETMLQVFRALPKLQEPERFRSWVVTIAYRQVQHHHRRQKRTLLGRHDPAEVADPGADFADRTVTELMLTGQRREVAEAARWLEPADRDLLSLWWQEAAGQLTRAELATALDVNPQHAAVRLQRMKAQLDVARMIVRALREVPMCGQLATAVRGWDGRPRPLWRKRLNRHVRGCDQCRGQQNGLIPPEKLLAGIGLVAMPAALQDSLRPVLEAAVPAVASAAAAGGHLLLGKLSLLDQLRNLLPSLSAKPVAAAATVTVIAAGGLTYTVLETPTPQARPPAVSPTAAQRALAPTPTAAPAPARTIASPTAAAAPPAVSGVLEADIYVAPNGSDGADGTLARPYATLGKAVAVARPGLTIALRGGTYRPAEPVTITISGTPDARITLSNYRDETPVIDASRVPADKWMITQQASHWTVQGLEIKNSKSHAYACLSCQYVTFRRLSIHDNVESGLTVRGANTIGNQVLDSDFFDNQGIGLGIKFGSGADNVIRGCRAYQNGDDGIDLGAFASPVTVQSNWAYGNGDGFVLGGGNPVASAAHVVRDNAAWDNTHHGFTDGTNPGRLQLTRNTSYHNGAAGYFIADAPATLRDNIGLANDADAKLGAGVQAAGNSWNGEGRTAAMFGSTDPTTARGPRRPDGGLPTTTFLTTNAGLGASMTR
ncbi:sigma-70 family RNA polymerase sigma factor [Phytohabitans rumicis]|uniref:sigma-70 family RNA polymerase sigma factor n=1 Tax=Phytohabitans rumicis TaxID=1076125 RepID=UPI00156308CA|nr:sigma-70 family RNA polymerase sigma factor [Phytohabitans rumicis]